MDITIGKRGEAPRLPKRFDGIVKVQTPLESNMEDPEALVYNEDRTLFVEVPIDDKVADVMEGDYKRFVFAKVRKGKLKLGNPAPWQGW